LKEKKVLDKIYCRHCGVHFVPDNVQVEVCGKECKKARAKKRNQKQADALKRKTIAKRAATAEQPCIICGTMFKPIREDGVTCGATKCKNERSKVHRKTSKTEQNEKTYNDRLKSKLNIDKFDLTKKLKARKKTEMDLMKSTNSKLAETKALEYVSRYIKDLDKSSDEYKILTLERDYIRQFQIDRLRANIKAVLHTEHESCDYSLQDIGNVLGITRERVRQIETNAMKLIKRPNVARELKEYSADLEPSLHEQMRF
jgi:hypothetical protein